VFFKHLETTSRYMRVYYCYYKGNWLDLLEYNIDNT
jgi:hypothetical protein